MRNSLKLLIAALAIGGTVAGTVAYTLSNEQHWENPIYAKSNIITCYDRLTADVFTATTTEYKDFSEKGRYSGNSAKTSKGAIQLRASKPSGIVTVTSPGKLYKIEVDWSNETSTAGDRQLDFYGKDTAYNTASELYNNANQGTKLGSIVCGNDTELVIDPNYDFIGFRSKKGSLYVNSITLYYQNIINSPLAY